MKENILNRQKILIIDDMPANVAILGVALKDDYDIVVATNGDNALKLASSANPPDLILLDIIMPVMDGYEVCKKLKEDERTRDIPIIFITAKGEVEDETKGLELGAVDYISKPFHLPIIRARVKTQLRLKRKTDMLESLVSIDGLTDIPNRRCFDETIEKEWRRALRSKLPISLMMIDVDLFKRFNDNYGHAAGDECLRKIAQTIKNTIKRGADFVARYGGEEFIVILPETDINGGLNVAENIHKNIHMINIPHAFSDVSDHVTLSIGLVSSKPAFTVNYFDLLKISDDMLYEAKKGRNRTCHKNIEQADDKS